MLFDLLLDPTVLAFLVVGVPLLFGFGQEDEEDDDDDDEIDRLERELADLRAQRDAPEPGDAPTGPAVDPNVALSDDGERYDASGAAQDLNVIGGEGDDDITTGSGDDVVAGEGGDDAIVTGPGDDRLLGGGGDDLLNGGEGADVIDGGAGADTISAGAGDDRVFAGEDGDDVIPGAGDDVVDLGAGDDLVAALGTLGGSGGDDVIRGGAGDDDIADDAGANTLFGGAGDDRIDLRDEEAEATGDVGDGGDGDDVLIGDRGDRLTGGDGEDAFSLYAAAPDLVPPEEPDTPADPDAEPAPGNPRDVMVVADFAPGTDGLEIVLPAGADPDAPISFVETARGDAEGLDVLLGDAPLVFLEGLAAGEISPDDVAVRLA